MADLYILATAASYIIICGVTVYIKLNPSRIYVKFKVPHVTNCLKFRLTLAAILRKFTNFTNNIQLSYLSDFLHSKGKHNVLLQDTKH